MIREIWQLGWEENMRRVRLRKTGIQKIREILDQCNIRGFEYDYDC